MKTETDVQNLSVWAIQKAGGVALRNNSGVAREVDRHGQTRVVRYGLGNTSERFNRECKSGDLVGIAPDGIFCMWECKPPDWRYTGTDRERAQWNAILWARRHRGRAGFVTHPDEAVAVMLGISGGAYG